MGEVIRANDRHPDAANEKIVGGKAASLAVVRGLGFTVPPFAVVTVDAFRAMESTDFEPDFLTALRSAYDELGGDRARLAVRSSAIGEDSRDKSFAGLYDTVLNVSGFDEVLSAIRTCWASYSSEPAVNYRTSSGEMSPGGMAVVIQQMIDGEWSGVTFTANPVTSALGEVIINAVPGLGEKLVAGDVNPEQLTLRVAGGEVLQRSSGTSGSRVPDDVVARVFETSKLLAEQLGFPQDVEWTVKNGNLFILQSRPITTISGIYYNRFIEPWRDTPESGESPDKVWSRAYGDEIWTSPTSPLFYNLQDLSGTFASNWEWHGDATAIPPAVFKYYKAAAYVDVALLQRLYEYQPRLARLDGLVNFFPSEMQGPFRAAPWRWRGRLKQMWRFEVKQRATDSLRANHRLIEEQWPAFVEVSDKWLDTDLDSMSVDELRGHLAELFAEMGTVGLTCATGVLVHAHNLTLLLTGLLDRWFGDGDNRYVEVSSGLPGSETVKEAQAIWELARMADANGAVATDLVMGGNWDAIEDAAESDPSLKPFFDQLAAFLRAHRHRGASYKDLIYPRWGDDPRLLLNMVAAHLSSTAVSPAEQNREQGVRREQAQATLLGRLTGIDSWKRLLLKRLFRYNELYMAVRDNHRFYFDRVWFQLRRIYLSFGARLVEEGRLVDPSEVFYLGAAEIEEALAGVLSRDAIVARVEVRSAEWHETLRSQAPKFLKGYVPFSDVGAAEPGVSALPGIAGSPGTATGRARVLFEIDEIPRVDAGDILVTRQTDPGWTPVFAKIAGLVLETGGVLAHGTSLCREYGLPCVTALEGATRLISDGDLIRVDGSDGRVVVLSAAQ